MSEQRMVKLERRRNMKYVINHDSLVGGKKVFAGSKNGNPVQASIPMETYEYLLNSTNCFKKGQLYVVDEGLRANTLSKDILNETHTSEEIKKILGLSIVKMEKALEGIESVNEKQFVLQVAKEMGIDSTGKKKAILKFCGMETDADTMEIIFEAEA